MYIKKCGEAGERSRIDILAYGMCIIYHKIFYGSFCSKGLAPMCKFLLL